MRNFINGSAVTLTIWFAWHHQIVYLIPTVAIFWLILMNRKGAKHK